MLKEDRNNEAAIHFELFRLIKNSIHAFNLAMVQYSNIQPEMGLKSGSVDLVIEVRKKNMVLPLLAIEVKKPTRRSYLLYEKPSVNQIKRYAKELQSPYSALTDGQVLRFFEQRKTSIKHWQGYEYVEVNDIDVLKRLFTERFINGKRRLDLFEALGLKYKPISGRPKKPRAKRSMDIPKGEFGFLRC